MSLRVAAAVAFGGLLVVTRAAQSPLDDTDRRGSARASSMPVSIVVAGSDQRCPGGSPLVADPPTAIARRSGMREPRGGGAPVGYAVVDAGRRIRYRTLDPTVHDELSEVDTILAALR